MDKIIDGYRELTGKAVMLPKWAFGYIQSKEVYHDQDEFLETARRYREKTFPLTVWFRTGTPGKRIAGATKS